MYCILYSVSMTKNNNFIINCLLVLYDIQLSVLVVKMVTDASDLLTGYGQYRSAGGPRPPEGHFIILPSASGSLLVKSLAVSELVLPADFAAVEQQSQDCLDNMSHVLDKVSLRHYVRGRYGDIYTILKLTQYGIL